MNAMAPFLVAILVAPPVAYATKTLYSDGDPITPESIADPSDGADAKTLQLESQLSQIEARLNQLAQLAEARSSGGTRQSVDELAAGISSALQQHGLRIDLAAAKAFQVAQREAREDLIRRVDASLASEDAMEFAEGWRRLAEEGLLDTALDVLKQRSDLDPSDVQAAEDLARAAAAAMGAVPVGPRSVQIGNVADEAFQRALASAPERNDLRLDRATTLASMPAFLGRRGEAIVELETVILNGESGAKVEPDSYALLGTLLLEKGSRQRALEAWQRGAGAFPDDKALLRLLELHQDQTR